MSCSKVIGLAAIAALGLGLLCIRQPGAGAEPETKKSDAPPAAGSKSLEQLFRETALFKFSEKVQQGDNPPFFRIRYAGNIEVTVMEEHWTDKYRDGEPVVNFFFTGRVLNFNEGETAPPALVKKINEWNLRTAYGHCAYDEQGVSYSIGHFGRGMLPQVLEKSCDLVAGDVGFLRKEFAPIMKAVGEEKERVGSSPRR